MTRPDAAVAAWTFGLRFLRNAERLSTAETPQAAIRAGYYAMFHCARAVLIKRD